MRLKKFLKSSWGKGQVTVEYFVLLCIMAALTIIGSSGFFTKVGRTTNSFMMTSVAAMEQPNINAFE